MLENVMPCLVFAAQAGENAERVVSLLHERDFDVTRAKGLGEYLDLLRGRRWRLLIVDAAAAPDSLRLLSQAREMRPDVPVVVLVRGGDVEMAVRAMKAGAADCVETPLQPACLLAAIEPFREPRDPDSEGLWVRLTHVEQTVLRHILNGRTNRQIADLFSRSPRTIEVHRRHVMQKLKADNLIDLVRQAMRAGLLDVSQSRAPAAPHRGGGRTRDFPTTTKSNAAASRLPPRRVRTT